MKKAFSYACFGILLLAASLTSCTKDGDPSPEATFTITEFSPASGTERTQVVITGTKFPETITETAVTFNGVAAEVISVGENTLVTRVPAGATTGKIKISLNGIGLESETDFTVVSNPWKKVGSMPFSEGRQYAVAFSLDGQGYVGLGYSVSTQYNNFWRFDPVQNKWTRIADFPGVGRYDAVAFTVAGKAYVGLGKTSTTNPLADFWEYTPVTNTWREVASLPSSGRSAATAFAIENHGYVVGGYTVDVGYHKEVWQYTPATNTWLRKKDYSGTNLAYAASFQLGGKGYVGSGINTQYLDTKEFWEYTPATDTWLQKADIGTTGRSSAVGFSAAGAGYIGTGSEMRDFWKYNPSVNSWTQVTDFMGGYRSNYDFEDGTRTGGVAFVINNRPFVGSGDGAIHSNSDFWEYFPE